MVDLRAIGKLEALASACLNSTIHELANKKISLDDFVKKPSQMKPLFNLADSTHQCIIEALAELANKGVPRVNKIIKGDPFLQKYESHFDQLNDLLEDSISSNLMSKTGHLSKEERIQKNTQIDDTWMSFRKNELFVKVLQYLETEGAIKKKDHFSRFLHYRKPPKNLSFTERKNGVLNFRNAGAHTEERHNKKILVEYQQLIFSYPSILEELPRFFSVLSYLFKLNWYKEKPVNILDAWNGLQLEPENLSSDNQDDLSTTALRRSLSRMDWPNYIDKQNRLENLMRDINSSKVIKIVGIGGLGKTALIYQTLRHLIDDEEWKNHEFYPFTIKNKKQGEFTETGWKSAINYTNLKYGQSVWSMAHKLATKSPNFEHGMSHEQIIDMAISYMKEKPCFVIIDNAEDIEDLQVRENVDKTEFDLLERFWMGVSELPPSNQSRLIITSRFPKDYPGVNTVEAKFLNEEEVEQLATERGDYYWSRWQEKSTSEQEKAPRPIYRHVRAGVTRNDWNEMSAWIRDKLGPQEKKTIGHPHFIIIAAYEYSTSRQLSMKDLLHKLIDESPIINDLDKYVSSKSIDYLPEAYTSIVGKLAMATDSAFSLSDVKSLVPEDSIGMADGIVSSLLELNLIKESATNTGLRYAFLDYARREFSSRYRDSSEYRDQPRKTRDADIDKLRESIKKAKQAPKNDTKAFEKVVQIAKIVDSKKLPRKQDERIKEETLLAQHDIHDLVEKSSPAQKEILNRTVKKIGERTADIILEEIERSNSPVEKSEMQEAFIHILRTTDWSGDLSGFDEKISEIFKEREALDSGRVWFALEDLIVYRLNQKDNADLYDLIELSMHGWYLFPPSTLQRIVAAIADNRVKEITLKMRKNVSNFLSSHDPRLLNMLLEYSQSQSTFNDLLDIFSKKWVDNNEEKIHSVYDLTTRITDPQNFCSTFYLRTDSTDGNSLQMIIDSTAKAHQMRILVYSPPFTFRKGTSSPLVHKLQHLFTNQGEMMTIINVKYLEIDQEKSKEAKQSPPINKQPKLQTDPPRLEPRSGTDLKSKYAEILLQVLTYEPQLFSIIGNLVHEMCLEKLGMSGKEVRAKVFPEKIKLIDAYRKLIGEKAVIVDASTHSTISLRR